MIIIFFLSLVGFFSSTMEMIGSKQHPIVPFTLSARFKDLVLTLVIYHTTLLWGAVTASHELQFMKSSTRDLKTNNLSSVKDWNCEFIIILNYILNILIILNHINLIFYLNLSLISYFQAFYSFLIAYFEVFYAGRKLSH